jgi:hypothetical protein
MMVINNKLKDDQYILNLRFKKKRKKRDQKCKSIKPSIVKENLRIPQLC